jgi:hypothetical protein
MQNGLLKMFVIPIETFSVPNWGEWKPKILSSLGGGSTLAKIDVSGRASLDDMKSDFFDNNNAKRLPTYYQTVREALRPILDEFQETYPIPVDIINMWYQTTASGQMHGVHNHGPTGVSAVFYVNFDPKVHKPTTFISPFPSYINGEVMDYTPDVYEGDVIFFPSFLMHMQEPNKSSVPRTIVSFNIAGKPQTFP